MDHEIQITDPHIFYKEVGSSKNSEMGGGVIGNRELFICGAEVVESNFVFNAWWGLKNKWVVGFRKTKNKHNYGGR